VRSARHAVSIDERRKTFSPTLWENLDALNDNARAGALDDRLRPYQQQWFPGVHGDVGGGGDDHGISLAAMLWIAEGAARAGFGFDEAQVRRYEASVDPCAKFVKPGFDLGGFIMELDGVADRRGPTRLSETSLSARLRWSSVRDYRPAPLRRFPGLESELNMWAPDPETQSFYRP
jgi:uncharacterized protein (DUF2235 family)